MSQVSNLIREIRRELVNHDGIALHDALEPIFAKYAAKKPKAIPAVRKKPRVRKTVVRLKGADMAQLRALVYVRDGGRCVDCHDRLYMTQPPFMELSHIKSRGAGGGDTMENCVTRCRECHQKSHNAGGKPCPAKSVPTTEQQRG